MKAKLVAKPPATGDWIYELKFDGIRLIGIKRDEKVSLLSRNQNELTERFPEIVEAIRILPVRECVIDGEAEQLLGEVKRRGLEGIIGKQRNSVYEPGRRSGAWIKLKCVSEQEFVIGGYTPPQGSRKNFGAILVGYYKDNRLMFAGKVGTGFTANSLSMMHKKFRTEKRDDCPF